MTISADEILRKALELNEPDRARLVTELLGTLEPESAAAPLSDKEWVAKSSDAPGRH